MRWRDTTGTIVVGALAVSSTATSACAHHPPPATPESAGPGGSSALAQNTGGLYFDPQGADFTRWINEFKNEVYRNWIVPQKAISGSKGHADFEFTVERDGSMSALRLLRSSGTASLDRAAELALTSSRCSSLPGDYTPPRVTMQVTFYYNEAPK